MSHAANTRAFSRRMGRGFWSRARKFSESAKPAPATSLLAGTTGADSGSDSNGGDHEAVTRCSDESTKRTVARCVGGTDAPHVASPRCGETAGASANCGQKGGDTESIQNQQRPSPSPDHSAGGGVLSVMLAAQVHADRWATLAVIAIFICAFAVAAIRANRSSRPTTPPRGQSAARPRLSGDE